MRRPARCLSRNKITPRVRNVLVPPILLKNCPIGKLRLRMFDNLAGAHQAKLFAACAERRLQ